MKRAESLTKLRPRHAVIGGVHGQKAGPPRTCRALKLMGGEERLLVILTAKKDELLLDRLEPVIGIQRILSSREDRRLSPQEV